MEKVTPGTKRAFRVNRKVAGALAVLLVLATLITSTLAWAAYNNAQNEVSGQRDIGVELREDFDSETGKKNVWVENTGVSTNQYLYVRIKLSEFMGIWNDTEDGYVSVLDDNYVATANPTPTDETSDYIVPETAWTQHSLNNDVYDCGEIFHNYWSWKMGNVDEDIAATLENGDNVTLPESEVMTLAEWRANGEPADCWVLAEDGYFYYTSLLGPNSGTGLLLNWVTQTTSIENNYYYSINVEMDAVNEHQLTIDLIDGDKLGPVETEDAQKLLKDMSPLYHKIEGAIAVTIPSAHEFDIEPDGYLYEDPNSPADNEWTRYCIAVKYKSLGHNIYVALDGPDAGTLVTGGTNLNPFTPGDRKPDVEIEDLGNGDFQLKNATTDIFGNVTYWTYGTDNMLDTEDDILLHQIPTTSQVAFNYPSDLAAFDLDNSGFLEPDEWQTFIDAPKYVHVSNNVYRQVDNEGTPITRSYVYVTGTQLGLFADQVTKDLPVVVVVFEGDEFCLDAGVDTEYGDDAQMYYTCGEDEMLDTDDDILLYQITTDMSADGAEDFSEFREGFLTETEYALFRAYKATPAWIRNIQEIGIGKTFVADGYTWVILNIDANDNMLILPTRIISSVNYRAGTNNSWFYPNYNYADYVTVVAGTSDDQSPLKLGMNNFYNSSIDLKPFIMDAANITQDSTTTCANTNISPNINLKVFPLSSADYSAYFSGNANNNPRYQYRVANGTSGIGNASWWLRSQGDKSGILALDSYYQGRMVNTSGTNTSTDTNTNQGVRPAMWININEYLPLG